MGWLYMPRASMGPHATAKAYLDAQFTYAKRQADGSEAGLTVLASACPQNRVYYAAAQAMRKGVGGEVFAIVCLVRWNPRDREGMIFGYKDMDETMGPCEAECPERILRLLTPTGHDSALEWRRRCRARLALRNRSLADGDRIHFAEPMRFTDGHVGQEFDVERIGRRIVLRAVEGRGRYRISRLMDRAWTIVPRTRVHATLFA